MFIPGIVSATFKERSVDEVIDLALSSGLKAIEWSENHHFDPLDLGLVEEIGNKTRRNGLEIASYGSYFRLGQNMDFSTSLNAAERMGAKNIRIWGGAKASKEIDEVEWKSLTDEAKEVALMAKEKNIRVSLEWHRNTVTDSNESALRFLSSVNEADFGCFWQPTPNQSVEYRAQGIEKAISWITNIHVYYWDESGRRPLTEGKEDWKEYLGRMTGNRYLLLEFVKDNSVDQFKKDAETLLSWINGGKENG